MLFRLILLLGLIAAGAFAVSWVRANKKRLLAPGRRLALGDSASAPEMKRALGLRAKVIDLLEKHTSVGTLADGEQTQARVNALVEQLAAQVDVRARIRATLEADANAMVESELAGDADSAADRADPLHAQASLRRERFARLRERRDELDESAQSIVLALENVHLALLDAASSSAGIGSPALLEARAALEQTASNLSAQSTANEEISRLLTQSADRTAALEGEPR